MLFFSKAWSTFVERTLQKFRKSMVILVIWGKKFFFNINPYLTKCHNGGDILAFLAVFLLLPSLFLLGHPLNDLNLLQHFPLCKVLDMSSCYCLSHYLIFCSSQSLLYLLGVTLLDSFF